MYRRKIPIELNGGLVYQLTHPTLDVNYHVLPSMQIEVPDILKRCFTVKTALLEGLKHKRHKKG